MAQFSPIDYGPPVSANLTGVRAMEGAVEEHGQKLVGAERALGQAGEQTAGAYTQNVLHRQVAGAMTKAAEGTEQAINTIETNPYVISKDDMGKAVGDPEVADALWQKAVKSGSIERDEQGHEFVPTHVIGRDMYAAMAKKSREEAAKSISLPGWRSEFLKTAETEAIAKQERWVDPKLAAHQVAYDRAKTLSSVDKAADLAQTPEDFELPLGLIKTSPSFSPEEKLAKTNQLNALKDTVVIDRAMTNPVANKAVLQTELGKLQGPDAGKLYPAHDEKQRAELAHHVMMGIKMADLQDEAAMRAKEHADKMSDDQLALGAIKGLLTHQIDPANLFDSRGITDNNSNAHQLWNGFKTHEGIENFFRITETFLKNEQAGLNKDVAGAYQAATALYMADPEKFKAALFSGQREKTPFGDFNFTTALSRESMHHFMGLAGNLSEKERAQEDRVKEEALERRLAVAMTSEEGGGVDKSDFANPQERPQYAEHEQFVRDALTNEQRAGIKSGKHLTPEQEMTVMLNAAKQYKESGHDGIFGKAPEKGTEIQTGSGTVKLPLSERTAMEQARRESGGVGVLAIQKDGQDFYDNYKTIIDAGWRDKMGGEELSSSDRWRVYYEAKKLAFGQSPISDPARQVAVMMDRIARAASVKKTGGTK